MSFIALAEKFRAEIAQRKLKFSSVSSKTSTDALKKLIEKSAQNLDISAYEDEFKQYLQKETGLSEEDIFIEMDKLEELLVFSGKDVQTIQEEINAAIENGEQQDEMSTVDNMLSVIFEDENIKALLDIDQNGELDSNEIMQYLKTTSLIDGNGENLSLDDLLTSIESLAKGITPEDILTEEVAPSGTPLSKPNTHSSNYKEPDGTLVSYSKEDDLNSINEKIAEANNQIVEKNNQKAQIKAQDVEYCQMISDLNDRTSAISDCENIISSLQGDLHTIEYDLIAVQTELDNLSDPVIFTEQQADIDELRQQLESQKTNLETQKAQKQEELEKEESNLEILNTEKTNLESQIADYEAQHPDNEIDEINAEIEAIKQTIAQYESDKEQIEQELNTQREQELEDAEVYGRACAYRESELVKFMMDYATDPETKEYYDKWYYEKFNGKAYCSVFTSNVVELMYAKAADKLGLSADDLKTLMANSGDLNNKSQGLTGTQFACSSDKWGEKVQPALDAAGIDVQATIDITDMTEQERKDAVRNGLIYPGMIFTYKRADGGYHTGFIESINKDLSWNTIEGNTAVTYDDGTSEIHTVGAHRRDGSYEDLAAVNDPTCKVLYWLKKLGYSDEAINALIYGKY